MFIAGFTLVFVVFFGALAGFIFGNLGQTDVQRWLVIIGGILLIILGIHMLGVLKWLIGLLENAPSVQKPLAWIDRKLDNLILPERRKQAGIGQSPGYVRSGLVGMTFAAGWTPCVGPLLGAIITLGLNASITASPSAAVLQSTILLFAYSMGLAIPFFIVAWGLDRATGLLRRLSRHVHLIEKISAFFLITIGVLLLVGSVSLLNQYFSATPEWLYEFESNLFSSTISLPLAFLAGLLSFLSPCVLPLIPIYLGYLTGVAAASHSETPA
jgi:cytochrome c-type biogenesis protein